MSHLNGDRICHTDQKFNKTVRTNTETFAKIAGMEHQQSQIDSLNMRHEKQCCEDPALHFPCFSDFIAQKQQILRSMQQDHQQERSENEKHLKETEGVMKKCKKMLINALSDDQHSSPDENETCRNMYQALKDEQQQLVHILMDCFKITGWMQSCFTKALKEKEHHTQSMHLMLEDSFVMMQMMDSRLSMTLKEREKEQQEMKEVMDELTEQLLEEQSMLVQAQAELKEKDDSISRLREELNQLQAAEAESWVEYNRNRLHKSESFVLDEDRSVQDSQQALQDLEEQSEEVNSWGEYNANHSHKCEYFTLDEDESVHDPRHARHDNEQQIQDMNCWGEYSSNQSLKCEYFVLDEDRSVQDSQQALQDLEEQLEEMKDEMEVLREQLLEEQSMLVQAQAELKEKDDSISRLQEEMKQQHDKEQHLQDTESECNSKLSQKSAYFMLDEEESSRCQQQIEEMKDKIKDLTIELFEKVSMQAQAELNEKDVKISRQQKELKSTNQQLQKAIKLAEEFKEKFLKICSREHNKSGFFMMDTNGIIQDLQQALQDKEEQIKSLQFELDEKNIETETQLQAIKNFLAEELLVKHKMLIEAQTELKKKDTRIGRLVQELEERQQQLEETDSLILECRKKLWKSCSPLFKGGFFTLDMHKSLQNPEKALREKEQQILMLLDIFRDCFNVIVEKTSLAAPNSSGDEKRKVELQPRLQEKEFQLQLKELLYNQEDVISKKHDLTENMPETVVKNDVMLEGSRSELNDSDCSRSELQRKGMIPKNSTYRQRLYALVPSAHLENDSW